MLVGRRLAIALACLTAWLMAWPDAPAPPPREHRGAPPELGQWVWTHADAELVDEGTTAGIFVGTVRFAEKVTWTRALSPTLALESRTRAAVIRFDDSLHPHWNDRGFEVALTAELEAILAQVGPVREIQLDYDAPTRRIARWGQLVRRWSTGPLAAPALWVTSIPAHLADPAGYRRAFDGAIAGHIMQVFDTGLACTPAQVDELARHAEAAGLPYRVGVGAFERGHRSDHGAWFRQWRRLGHSPGFAGLWVFPAGQPYRHLIDS